MYVQRVVSGQNYSYNQKDKLTPAEFRKHEISEITAGGFRTHEISGISCADLIEKTWDLLVQISVIPSLSSITARKLLNPFPYTPYTIPIISMDQRC